MDKTLGGFAFIKDGITFDYCFEESIKSMCQCCDAVSVVYISGGDDTNTRLYDLTREYSNLKVHVCNITLWWAMIGKTKLSNFQNIAAMCLDTDYQLLIQADEVIHPDSYGAIREAMETGGEGFLCERVNLWGSPNTMLVVPQERQPCSVHVNRLTKRGYWCYDDGESIASPTTLSFANRIKIIHYGFVRRKEVMKAKIINMQQGVFAMENYDAKLDQCEVFDSTLWFSGTDLAPINFTHPPIMNQWIIDRM